MQIKKAVITVAGRNQSTLPMQTLYDASGTERSILSIIVGEALSAGISEICLVVRPGDEESYSRLIEKDAARVTFVRQNEALGYAHAIYCARDFVNGGPFLHMVGDHIYVGAGAHGCATSLVQAAAQAECAISAVQVTREHLLPLYGTIGGQPVAGNPGFFRVDTVLEKPTPTQAEQHLMVPGLRNGQYLCFFGMHVLTPQVFDILGSLLANPSTGRISLSSALALLAQHEQYLAMIQNGQRYDVGVRYGLFTAQLALAVNGQDRDDVLSLLLNVLASREMRSSREAGA